MEHHGKLLKRILKENRVNKSDLAEKIGYSRAAIYSFFDREKLPFEVLKAIKEAARVDFSLFADVLKFDVAILEESNNEQMDSIKTKLMRLQDNLIDVQQKVSSALKEVNTLIEKTRKDN